MIRKKQGFIKTKGVAGWTMVPVMELEHYKQNVEPTAQPDDTINIGDWSGTRDQIMQTKVDWFKENEPEIDHDKANELTRSLNKRYWEFRREINSLSPREKAMRLELFNLLYWGIVRKHNIPNDIKKKVMIIQEKFFEKNPKRIFCDPILFKNVFNGQSKSFNPAIKVIEMAVIEDVRCVKFNN